MLNKNEIKGTVDQAKGKIKQAVGALTNDPQLKAEGQADEVVGKVEAVVGAAIRKVDDETTRVRKAVR